MRKKQMKFSKTKILLFTVLAVFVFSVIKVGITLASADSFKITDCQIESKSDTADVNSLFYDKCTITKDITFHAVGDSITYSITVKNNDSKNYTIKSITDNNANPYISYVYDSYEGTKLNQNEEITIKITEKYENGVEDISDRDHTFNVNFSFTIEDEEGNVSETSISMNNPKTGDNLGIYVTTSLVSLAVLIVMALNKMGVLKLKKGKVSKHFSILIIVCLLIPTISKAAENQDLVVAFDNTIALRDHVVVTYSINGDETELVMNCGDVFPEIEVPVDEGYEFKGWIYEDGSEFDVESPIRDDAKIKANIKPIEYRITYDLDDGTLETPNPTTYTIESDDITLNKPTKTNYTFLGWTGTGLNEETKEVVIPKGSIGDRSYTAKWQGRSYNVYFNGNGGDGYMSLQVMYMGETTALRANEFTKENQRFVGWNTDRNGNGTSYNNKENVSNLTTEDSITLYAMWDRQIVVGDYINYNANVSDKNGTEFSTPYTYTSQTEVTGGTPAVFSSEDQMKWRILSYDEDTGKIEIVSADATPEALQFKGPVGFKNAFTVLDDICNLYGHGYGAGEARCIELDDILQYSSFDVRTTSEYGKEGTLPAGHYIFEQNATIDDDGFIHDTYASEQTIATDSVDVIGTWFYKTMYNQFPGDLINFFFKNSNNSNRRYWLRNKALRVNRRDCGYYIMYAYDNAIGGTSLILSSPNYQDPYFWSQGNMMVCPVVTLDSNAKIEWNEADQIWEIQ